jgi:translation initiation factor 2B subunit (eIF-2B alpha/beta/delta family)
MTDTRADILSRPTTGLKVVAYLRDCGWHVILSETRPRNDGHYVPRIIAKACVDVYRAQDDARVIDQCRAMVIGLDHIIHDIKQTCNNL